MWGLAEAFDQLGKLVLILFVICCISIPLGIWKLVELIIEFFKHISISWN